MDRWIDRHTLSKNCASFRVGPLLTLELQEKGEKINYFKF